MSGAALRSGAAASSVALAGGGVLRPTVVNLVLVTVSTTRIDSSWDAVDGATGYEVERGTDGVTFVSVGSPAGTSFSDTTGSPGVHYYYRVRATAGSEVSDYSLAKNAWTLPGQVVGLTATPDVTLPQVVLAWAAATGAQYYNVFVKRSNVGAWPTIPSYTPSTNGQTATGLLPGTSYDFRVSAHDPAGNGAVSATATASTAAGSNTLAVGLQVAIDFDEASGDAIDKKSGANLTANAAPGSNTGRFGLGRTFNGTSQYFSRADGGAGDPYRVGEGGDWTILVGLNPDPTVTGTVVVCQKGNSGGTQIDFLLSYNLTNHNFNVTVADNKSIGTNDGELTVGDVDHLALVTYDAAAQSITLRANGAQDRTNAASVIIPNRANPFWFGRSYAGFWKGRGARFYKWNRKLEEYEKLYLLNGGLARIYDEVSVASPTPPALSGGPTLIYNAFAWQGSTDAIFHPETDYSYVVFRRGTAEVSSGGTLVVMRCAAADDFTTLANWSIAAILASPLSPETDLRDPKINRLDDGTLQITAAASNNTSSWKMVRFTSTDGTTWSAGEALTGLPVNTWLWRWENKPGGGYIGSGYTADHDPVTIILCESTDGLAWTVTVSPLDGPNESTEGCLFFRASDDYACYFARQDGTTYNRLSRWTAPPYTSWSIRDSKPTVPAGNSSRVAAPVGLMLPSGVALVLGRNYVASQRTQFSTVEPETGFSVQYLAVDTNQTESGYGGLIYRGELDFSFYSTAPGKASIFVGRMAAPV